VVVMMILMHHRWRILRASSCPTLPPLPMSE
jgi:hypothetical protein